ncbi:MAG: sigma-70 family RNA polymerase sigma factor [Prevotellaceae bacterium]|nr:sigma-70 family RNA polymerase sigma factor [Candidatus Minthosoma caballi]
MKLTQAIIDDFKAGKLDSFYHEAYPSLLTYAVRILTDGYAFLAEDCVQDCIFQSYQNRNRITDPISWKSFLYTTVHNSAISILRHHKAHENFLNTPKDDTDQDSSQLYIEQETLDLLYSAIEKLPEKYRAIFELSFEQGLSNPEIAEQLHLSVSGVKKQKSKMIQLLRSSLNNEAFIILCAFGIA